jgi:hypothetical protein
MLPARNFALQNSRGSSTPQVLVMVLDRFPDVGQAVSRDDEVQIVGLHQPRPASTGRCRRQVHPPRDPGDRTRSYPGPTRQAPGSGRPVSNSCNLRAHRAETQTQFIGSAILLWFNACGTLLSRAPTLAPRRRAACNPTTHGDQKRIVKSKPYISKFLLVPRLKAGTL